MKREKKWVLAMVAALGAALVAERALEHAAAERLRRVADADLDPLLILPQPVIRHDVPTHDGGSVHVVEHGTGPTAGAAPRRHAAGRGVGPA